MLDVGLWTTPKCVELTAFLELQAILSIFGFSLFLGLSNPLKGLVQVSLCQIILQWQIAMENNLG